MNKKSFLKFNLIRIVIGFCIASVLCSVLTAVAYYRCSHGKDSNRYLEPNIDLLVYSMKPVETRQNVKAMMSATYFSYCDYIRFARVTESGELETIYETEYDTLELWPGYDNKIVCLTDNPDKAGKIVYPLGQDADLKRIYVRCDEAMAEARLKKGLNGIGNTRFITSQLYYEPLNYDIVEYYVYPEVYVSGLINQQDRTLLDYEINRSMSFSEMKYSFKQAYEDNQYDRTSFVFAGIGRVHDRPDYILDKYGKELSPGKEELGSIRNAEFNSVEIPETIYDTKLKNNGPLKMSVIPKTISDGRYEVSYGYFKVNDDLYFYSYIDSYAGLWEANGLRLLELYVKIFILCILVSLLLGIRPYLRYRIVFGRTAFKMSLVDSLSRGIEEPVNAISETAVKISRTEDPEETDLLADSVLSIVSEMNDTVEGILKGVERNISKTRFRLSELIEEAAKEAQVGVRIKNGIKIKAERDYILRAFIYLMKDAARYQDPVDVRIRNSKVVITFRTDNYIPDTGMAVADKLLSKAGMQLIVNNKGNMIREEIRYRSKYEQ